MSVASRYHQTPIGTFATAPVEVSGSFRTNGAGAIDQDTITGGEVSTAARSGVGEFLVTLRKGYRSMITGEAHVQLNASGDYNATLGAVSNLGSTTATTVVIHLRDQQASAAADLASNANNRIHFRLLMSLSKRDD